MPTTIKGAIYVLVASAMFAMQVVPIRELQHLAVLPVEAVRCLFGGLVLAILARSELKNKLSGIMTLKALGCGFLGVFLVQALSLAADAPSNHANPRIVVMAVLPVATILLALVLKKEKKSPLGFVAVALSSASAIIYLWTDNLVAWFSGSAMLPYIFAASAFALTLLAAKSFSSGVSIAAFTSLFLTSGSIFCAAVSFSLLPETVNEMVGGFSIDGSITSSNLMAIGKLFFHAGIATALGWFCLFKGLDALKASTAAVLLGLATPIAFVLPNLIVSSPVSFAQMAMVTGCLFAAATALYAES